MFVVLVEGMNEEGVDCIARASAFWTTRRDAETKTGPDAADGAMSGTAARRAWERVVRRAQLVPADRASMNPFVGLRANLISHDET
jgi:hypothetical protein